MNRKSNPPFRTGPSHIGRYFFHDCDRFLRFSATRNDLAATQGIPQREFDTSPIMQAVLDHGYSWEQEVVKKLGQRVVVAPGNGKLSERKFSWPETVQLLRTEKPGRYIYQPTLHPPASFYAAYGLDAGQVLFADNHPDLFEITEDNGRRRFRVVDVKRGASLRASYRIQVLLYALQLQLVLQESGIDDAVVNLSRGAIWLGGEDAPEECDLEPVRPLVETFLRDRFPSILAMPAERADWHVHFRCEWCPYFDYCRAEMAGGNNVSRLTGLTVQGKKYLAHEAGVRTLDQLQELLAKPEADEVLSRAASLVGKRRRLSDQVQSYKRNAPVVGGASTPLLPIHENVALFITVQQEPLAQQVYLAGLLPSVAAKDRTKLSKHFDPEPRIWLADEPADAPAVRKNLVIWLYKLLREVDGYNRQMEWGEQLSVQVYMHSEHEKSLLIRLLLEALDDPELSEPAMQLLFYFQGPELLLAEDHPADAVHYPIVVLLGVQSRLVALPVDVSYTLPETLAALGSEFEYKRLDFYHFPLGPGLRPDAIYLAWSKDKKDHLPGIQKLAQNHLRAVRALLWALRSTAKDKLYAWPPKFTLPATCGIADPLLSRMAFFTRYESMLQCMAIREQRAEDRDVQCLLGQVVQLRAESASRFTVIEDCGFTLKEKFPQYLLVRDTLGGRKAQLEFQDYYYRAKSWPKQHPDRAVATIAQIEPDELGLPKVLEITARFEGQQATKGDRFLLYPRYTDYNSEKVMNQLRRLDEAGESLFLQLINNPEQASAFMALPKGIEAKAAEESSRLGLTPSQANAYDAIRNRRVLAVWGPPGTGKTHFLASIILGLASAHAQAGKPFHVLVTAFTHASIENVLLKVHQRTQALKLSVNLRIGKADGWRQESEDTGDAAPSKELVGWLSMNPVSVVGATVWSCVKLVNEAKFDLVIVDEASQVKVPEASIPTDLLADHGRIVFAGDHLQLPPIVAGVYPEPPDGEPVLHRSVFELLLSRCTVGAADGPCRQLLENWRMNDILTSYAAGLLYGPNYRCASKPVAARRMRLARPTDDRSLVDACLHPEHPLVIVIIEGAPAAKENAIEAGLVAELTTRLRTDLLKDKAPYRDDLAFFNDGLFIVSPHHVQIRLIRQALAAKRHWMSQPFVDTVDKMQGQEAEVVIVSYGVSDSEFALQEAEFIYGLNRLNVAVTRAKSKCIVCLPAPLLQSSPEVLDVEDAERGLAYMQRLVGQVQADGETLVFDLGDGRRAHVLRTTKAFQGTTSN